MKSTKKYIKIKLIDKTICIACAGMIGLNLTGCALPKTIPDIRLDGMPLMPIEKVARIMAYSSQSYHDRPLNTNWTVKILSIDENPIPKNVRYIQVTPGRHLIEYSCLYKFRYNDIGGGTGKATVSHIFKAGETIYAYANGKIIGYKDFGSIGIDSSGTCSIYGFSTRDPFYIL